VEIVKECGMKRALNIIMLLVIILSTSYTISEEQEYIPLPDELYQNDGSQYLVLPENYDENITEKSKPYRLLIIGVDTNMPSIRGRSDTMVLAVFDAQCSSLKLISFMRDLYVQIPRSGKTRLNASFSHGGPKLLIETLKNNFGVEVEGYIAVNYSSMIKLVDSIGGIDIEVLDEELKPLNGILEYYNYLNGLPEQQGKLDKAGFKHLSGLQAMSYARIRKIDSDYERIGRQQRVLMAILNRIRSLEISKILEIISENIEFVDTNITMSDAVKLTGDMLAVESLNTRYLRVPVKKAFTNKLIDGTYYVIPNINKNKKAIEKFIYD
jgi:LCP family protein required for cell wall assembly